MPNTSARDTSVLGRWGRVRPPARRRSRQKRQARLRDGIAAPLVGEHAAEVVAGLEEAVGERDQRPGVEVALNEPAPA